MKLDARDALDYAKNLLSSKNNYLSMREVHVAKSLKSHQPYFVCLPGR